MKLNKVMSVLRDENIDLRERIIDIETDYATLADSYRTFITVSQYEKKQNRTKQMGMVNFYLTKDQNTAQ